MTRFEFTAKAKASIEANKLKSFKKGNKEYFFDTITDEQIEALWADKDGKFDERACSIFQVVKPAEKTAKSSEK